MRQGRFGYHFGSVRDAPLNLSRSSTRQLIAAGIGLTLLGILLFAINDAVGKWILSTYALGQMLLVRSLAGLAIIAPIIWRTGTGVFTNLPQPGLQFVRAALSTLETAFFFWAVSFLPLADVTTFYLASPIFVTILAALFLGERVGWRRWSAIGVGFLGVVLALGPSASVATLPAAIALIGSLIFAVLMIITRHLRATPDVVLVGFQFLGAFIFGAVAAPFGWVPFATPDVALIVVIGALALGAHVCINRSLKLAPASTVAPYHYTLIVWAVVFGFVVFGDVPGVATLAGAALIIGSGLFIFFRERHLAPEQEPDMPER